MAAKRTVKDVKRPGGPPAVDYPRNITRALPESATRVRNTGQPVGPEHPRTAPRGTGTKSPLGR